MFIRDNHLHTHHSYDSDANFTDYLTHFDGEIVIRSLCKRGKSGSFS